MPSHYEQLKRRKIARVMREFKDGSLKSGSGEPVTDREQALAIALSEAQQEAGRRVRRRKPLGA